MQVVAAERFPQVKLNRSIISRGSTRDSRSHGECYIVFMSHHLVKMKFTEHIYLIQNLKTEIILSFAFIKNKL